MNPTYAQEFTFEHSDCVLRYQSYTGEREELRKQANGLLKERKYVTKQMLDLMYKLQLNRRKTPPTNPPMTSPIDQYKVF